jgi:hypothetical protein
MPSVTRRDLPPAWQTFLANVDRLLPTTIEVHCLGGFIAALYYDAPRPTGDLDYSEVVPHDAGASLREIAGPESRLAATHRLHFQHVGVASLPEGYVGRLALVRLRRLQRLKLLAVDPHDLALSKLARNSPVDREDVAQLARAVPLKADVLRKRYQRELRPIIIGDPAYHDRTLAMWIDAYLTP